MLNIEEVENAKALMNEAINWSVMRWLREEKRVRNTSDIANDKLDAVDREVKASWSDELKAAYAELPKIGMPAEQGIQLQATETKQPLTRSSCSSPRLSNKPTRGLPRPPACRGYF